MQAALIFESAMLIVGALWAQDAWGATGHGTRLRPGPLLHGSRLRGQFTCERPIALAGSECAIMIWAVFVIAFLTFFGVPFVTVAPHKGAI